MKTFRRNFIPLRHIPVIVLLLLSMLVTMTACRADVITMSPDQFLDRLNALCADDFGAVVETETVDAVTSLCRITDRMSLMLISDPVTGLLQRAELTLTFDPDITDLDYSSFSYFFLVMLKELIYNRQNDFFVIFHYLVVIVVFFDNVFDIIEAVRDIFALHFESLAFVVFGFLVLLVVFVLVSPFLSRINKIPVTEKTASIVFVAVTKIAHN